MLHRVLVVAVAITAVFVSVAPSAHAAFTPNGTEYHPLTFPVRETVHYTDDFGGPRQHPGNDLMGVKLDHELAANDGTITFARDDSSGHSGNMLILTGTDGWKYWYIHINNDTPGTDDAKNPAAFRFAPGIADGVHVKRGQFIAYMGDSGEAETTDPHLHFELHRPDDTFIDPLHVTPPGAGRRRERPVCLSHQSHAAPECRGRPGLLDARRRRHRHCIRQCSQVRERARTCWWRSLHRDRLDADR